MGSAVMFLLLAAVACLHQATAEITLPASIPKCFLAVSGLNYNLTLAPWGWKKWRELKANGSWGKIYLKPGANGWHHFFEDDDEDSTDFKHAKYDTRRNCLPNNSVLYSGDSHQWPKTYLTVTEDPMTAPYLGYMEAKTWRELGSGGHFNSFTKCFDAGMRAFNADLKKEKDILVGIQWHFDDDECKAAFANDGRFLAKHDVPFVWKYMFHYTRGKGTQYRAMTFHYIPAPGYVKGVRHYIEMPDHFTIQQCEIEARRRTTNAKYVIKEDYRCYATNGEEIVFSNEDSSDAAQPFFLRVKYTYDYCLDSKARFDDCMFCDDHFPTPNHLDTIYDLCCRTSYHHNVCLPYRKSRL